MFGKRVGFRPIEIIRHPASPEEVQSMRVGRDSPFLLRIRAAAMHCSEPERSGALASRQWKSIKLNHTSESADEVFLDVEHASCELGLGVEEIEARSVDDIAGLVEKAEQVQNLTKHEIPYKEAYKTVTHLENLQIKKLFTKPGQMSQTYRHADLFRTCEIIKNPENGEYEIFVLLNRSSDEFVGEGTATSVKTAINLRTGEKVALLSTLGKDVSGQATIEREKHNAKIVRGIKGFIPTYFLAETESKTDSTPKLRRFQPLCDGNLAQAFYAGALSSEDCKLVAIKLLEAIDAFHSAKMMHRDLKMENVLVKLGDDTLELYIADFGYSCNIADEEDRRNAVGNPASFSPEFAQGMAQRDFDQIQKAATFKHDIWGLGRLFLDLFEKQVSEEFADAAFAPTAYPADAPQDRDRKMDWKVIVQQVAALKSGYLPAPKNPIEKLLSIMLEPNPELRPDAKALLPLARELLA